MKTFVVLIPVLLMNIFDLYSQKIVSQSKETRPVWLENSYSSSKNYIYCIGTGKNIDYKKAREEAIDLVIIDLGIKSECEISVETEQNIRNMMKGDSVKTVSEYTVKSKVTGKPFKIKGLRVVDQYYEEISYPDGRLVFSYSILMSYPSEKGVDEFVDPDLSGLVEEQFGSKRLYSLFPITGGGQLYKKQKGKGVFLLTTSGLMLTSVGVSHYIYRHNFDLAQRYNGTNDLYYQEYKDYYKKALAVRNYVAIGWSALYVYSVIDALASRGKPVLANNERKLMIYPYMCNNTYQLGLTLNF